MNSSWVINVRVLTGSVVTYKWFCFTVLPKLHEKRLLHAHISVSFFFHLDSLSMNRVLKVQHSVWNPLGDLLLCLSQHLPHGILVLQLYMQDKALSAHLFSDQLCTITHVYIITLHHIIIIIYYVFVCLFTHSNVWVSFLKNHAHQFWIYLLKKNCKE